MRTQTALSTCRSCGQSITWIKTRRDKKMPVDGAVEETLYDSAKHVSHWDTCPQADQWRGLAHQKPQPEPSRHVIPPAMQDRLATIRTMARGLLKQGITVQELQAMSREETGLSEFKHLHCTSQQTLDGLIQRLETVQPPKNSNTERTEILMNTLIERLPKPEGFLMDQPIRLTNAAGTVIVELDGDNAWLVEPDKRYPLHMYQLRGVLSGYFAEPTPADLQRLETFIQTEIKAWDELEQHPLLKAPEVSHV